MKETKQKDTISLPCETQNGDRDTEHRIGCWEMKTEGNRKRRKEKDNQMR